MAGAKGYIRQGRKEGGAGCDLPPDKGENALHACLGKDNGLF